MDYKAIAERLANELNLVLSQLSETQRLDVAATVLEGYCKHCGGVLPAQGHCHCTNDE